MSNDILNTIEVLTSKVRAKEEEANKLKKLVNELCEEVEIPVRYPHISEGGAAISGIRSDQFYGQTLTAAIRNYLELRKAANLGAASSGEIFGAIKDGGYKFGTNNEDNAKISLGNALRKSSSIFHRLPNGSYGLLAWYPNAKELPDGNATGKTGKAKSKGGKLKHGIERTIATSGAALVTNKEIRDVVLAQQGEFQASDIEAAIRAKFPSKELRKTKIPSVLFILKTEKGLLKEVSPRSGKKGATYSKG
jgi:hypothetical protein